MPRCLRTAFLLAALAGAIIPWSGASAQRRVIRVMGDDGLPVAFANVTLAGERPRIADEKGELDVGAAARTIAVDVRRLGYEPWLGKLAIGDTVVAALVTLHRISRRMFTVTITDSSYGVPAYLRGFYERMLARQRGAGTGVYLTPEEIERRNAGIASSLLQGVNGVSLQRTAGGRTVAMSASGACQMTVLIDGHRVCPDNGCGGGTAAPPPASSTPSRGRGRAPTPPPRDEQFVLLDNLLGVNEIAAIEVYPRGATVPQSLPAPESSCGLIAVWTGGRRAP